MHVLKRNHSPNALPACLSPVPTITYRRYNWVSMLNQPWLEWDQWQHKQTTASSLTVFSQATSGQQQNLCALQEKAPSPPDNLQHLLLQSSFAAATENPLMGLEFPAGTAKSNTTNMFAY